MDLDPETQALVYALAKVENAAWCIVFGVWGLWGMRIWSLVLSEHVKSWFRLTVRRTPNP
jgi:hypothetical protein